ncbi:MAG: alpha/beta hydrolase [Betaproteobacteria bacterium]|nr:alpha/beta hydrolase [Betaproteobacteria bacterium]
MRPPPRAGSETLFVDGSAGRIETVIDLPASQSAGPALRGVALIAHPHPLFGGTLDNKVVQTLAKTFAELGYAAIRSNFRGVGDTDGVHDHGEGETADMLTLAAWARSRFAAGSDLPVAAAGFSFGAWIQTRLAERMKLQRLVLVALPAGFVSDGRSYTTGTVPADSIVIHGEQDETVPLANVLDWARPQPLAISVIPGADHFFHRKLKLIRTIIQGQWK